MTKVEAKVKSLKRYEAGYQYVLFAFVLWSRTRLTKKMGPRADKMRNSPPEKSPSTIKTRLEAKIAAP